MLVAKGEGDICGVPASELYALDCSALSALCVLAETLRGTEVVWLCSSSQGWKLTTRQMVHDAGVVMLLPCRAVAAKLPCRGKLTT